MKKILVFFLFALLAACANQQPTAVGDDAVTDTASPTVSSLSSATDLGDGPAPAPCQRPVKIPPEILQKIGFDLNNFDNEGMLTTGTGKRAIIYEYCIPRARQAVSVISTIDFSAEVKTDTPGKVNCSAQEVLVQGNSHQDNFKALIVQLARLPFVKRIEQSSVL